MVRLKLMFKDFSLLRKVLATPEYFAVISMILFGIAFILLIRPLSIPDEATHFYRAYQVSEGNFFVSGLSADNTCRSTGPDIKPHLNAKNEGWSMSLPRSVINFGSLGIMGDYSIRGQAAVQLNESDRAAICIVQTQANTPVGYIPQAVAIAALRPFNAAPIVMDYAARFAVLIIWIVCMFYAIRIIPVRKWTFVAIALLPMSIQQSVSIGADVLSIAPIALLLAIVVRSYYEDRRASFRSDMVWLSLLSTVATLSKPVMIISLLSIFLYNYSGKATQHKISKPLTSARYQLLIKLGASVVPVAAYLLWGVIASHNHVSITDVFYLSVDKIGYIKSSPILALGEFISQSFNFVINGAMFNDYASFAWFTHSVPVFWRFIGVATLFLVLITTYDLQKKPIVSRRRVSIYNSITVIAAIGIFAATLLTLFIIWTLPGAVAIDGFQFRYYISIFFILGSLIGLRFLYTTESVYRKFITANSWLFFVISVITLLT